MATEEIRCNAAELGSGFLVRRFTAGSPMERVADSLAGSSCVYTGEKNTLPLEAVRVCKDGQFSLVSFLDCLWIFFLAPLSSVQCMCVDDSNPKIIIVQSVVLVHLSLNFGSSVLAFEI
jgi:hypothetical protein